MKVTDQNFQKFMTAANAGKNRIAAAKNHDKWKAEAAHIKKQALPGRMQKHLANGDTLIKYLETRKAIFEEARIRTSTDAISRNDPNLEARSVKTLSIMMAKAFADDGITDEELWEMVGDTSVITRFSNHEGIGYTGKPHEELGFCYGASSHFLTSFRDEIRSGSDPTDAAIKAGSADGNVTPALLKQGMYLQALSRAIRSINELNDSSLQGAKITHQSHALDFEKRIEIEKRFEQDLPQKCLDVIQGQSYDVWRKHDDGSLNIVTANGHAVAYTKHDDTHYVFDPNFGVVTTQNTLAVFYLLGTFLAGEEKTVSFEKIE